MEPTTRRRAFGLAGAATAAAVVGTVVTARPASAADPDDVVKNTDNAVTDTTSLTGSLNTGPVLLIENTGTHHGLWAECTSTGAAVVARNRGSGSAAGLHAFSPDGIDVLANGSGRVRLGSHDYRTTNSYAGGEIHQSDGTLYATVSANTRRVVAGPATAGALHLIEPVRVYDSRRPAPSPGTLASSTDRLVVVSHARDLTTGAVTDVNVVPVGATGIAYNLTITNTSAGGFLSVAPGSATTIKASTINWSAAGSTVANASVVGLDNARRVRVFCGGGSTHFLIDVVGYYL